MDSGEAGLPTVIKSASTAAYDVYLKALDLKGGGLSGLQEKIRLLEHSLRLDANFAPAHASLAGFILALQDSFGYHGNLSREEALRRAIPHLDRAAELEPNLAQVHYVRALIAFDEKDRASVIEHAQKVLAVNPSKVGAMNLIAIAFQDLDRYEEMLEVYDQMFAVDPLSTLARSNYSSWLCEMGRIDEAREMAHQLLADDHWRGYRRLGFISSYEGKVAEAVSWFLKAHAEDPENSTSNRLLVNALILLDEYEEARRIGSRFATDVNIAEGRFLAAIQAMQTKLQLDPLNQRMILSAAETLYQAGRIDEALPLFERLREVGPEGAPIAMNYRATAHLAVARKRAGDESGARAAAQILRKSLSAFRQAFGKSSAVPEYDAMLAALDDNRDAVVPALRAATEIGLRSPQLFADVIFEDLWTDERFVSLQQEVDELLAEEHQKYLQLVCFNNPVPDNWRPLPQTCDGVIEQPVL
jgi:tetratricopeptide (TPR) repeat protein